MKDAAISPPHTSPALDELLRHARQGKREALGQLLQNYRPYMMRIAHERLPAWLQGKVGESDVVQDALGEALAGFEQFRGLTLVELRGWLRVILVRQVRQATGRFVAPDGEVELQAVAEPAADQSSPSAKVGREELNDAIWDALERLPEHYRQVLVWRQWEDLPFAEIADRLDRSVDAARMLWWRAAERFQDEMGRSDDSSD